MKQWLILAAAAVAALSGGTSGIAQTAARPAIADTSVRDDRFPVMEAHFPAGIVAQPHVEFANYVGFRPLQLDLYLHEDRRTAPARPLVIWVHGGGWNRGDARGSGAFRDWPAVLAALAARGYVVASVDYRLSGEARFPAQVQDIKAAIRFLRSGAADDGIDPSRVYLWGGSAGGHLAALATLSCGVSAFDPAASTGRLPGSQAKSALPLPQSDCVQGAAIWYGVFDFMSQAVGSDSALAPASIGRLLGCDPTHCDEARRLASPITYVKRDEPPLLLLHGTADEEVSVEQTRHMVERLRAVNAPVDVAFIAGSNHGWIGKTPADTQRDSLSALDRTLAFFDSLGKR